MGATVTGVPGDPEPGVALVTVGPKTPGAEYTTSTQQFVATLFDGNVLPEP